MPRERVLFVCRHNSARSQMAEALLNVLGGDRFDAESAGLEPGHLNPIAIRVMAELGIDISQKKTRSVFALYRAGQLYSYVITVCDQASGEKCPVFPGISRRLHWSFEDPSELTGTQEEKLEGTRRIRDQIRSEIVRWLSE